MFGEDWGQEMKKSTLVPIFVPGQAQCGGLGGGMRISVPTISFTRKGLSFLGMNEDLPLLVSFMEDKDPERSDILIVSFDDEWNENCYSVSIVSIKGKTPAFIISAKLIRKALIDRYSIDVPARFLMKKRRTKGLSFEVNFGDKS